MNETKRPKAAPRRRWLRKVGIALIFLIALWSCVTWAPFAPEPIDPGVRLFLAKAARAEVNVYASKDIPGQWEDAPPEDLSEPVGQMSPDEVVVAEVLRTPDEMGARWAAVPGGCARLQDLTPATADDCGVPEAPGHGHLAYLPHGADPCSENAEGWYGTRDQPVIYLFSRSRYVLYRVRPDGELQWMMAHDLGENSAHRGNLYPGVYVWPRPGTAAGVPDVLLFDPPLGLVCFRWRGDAFKPGVPTPAQLATLVRLVVHEAYGWVGVAWLVFLGYWGVKAGKWRSGELVGCRWLSTLLLALVAILGSMAWLLWAAALDDLRHSPPWHVP